MFKLKWIPGNTFSFRKKLNFWLKLKIYYVPLTKKIPLSPVYANVHTNAYTSLLKKKNVLFIFTYVMTRWYKSTYFCFLLVSPALLGFSRMMLICIVYKSYFEKHNIVFYQTYIVPITVLDISHIFCYNF